MAKQRLFATDDVKLRSWAVLHVGVFKDAGQVGQIGRLPAVNSQQYIAALNSLLIGR